MNTYSTRSRGFTLIELLVVISIIGMLSSVVLVSLSSARARAADAAIRQEILQFRNLLELEYSGSKSYSNLQPSASWITTAAGTVTCENVNFAGTYAAQAVMLCNDMLKRMKIYDGTGSPGSAGLYLRFRTVTNDPSKYSITAWLPGVKNYICVGSSGTSLSTSPNSADTGCYTNP